MAAVSETGGYPTGIRPPLPYDMPDAATLQHIALWPWAEVATLAFAFIWGAIIGSFINVVVHRVPRGESVVVGRSRCPACGSPIRALDNVPVVGWLWLGGRCRDCRRPISAAYPLVEAGCGLLVAVVAACDLYPGGLDRLLVQGDWRPLVAWAWHSAILLGLAAWALLLRGGKRVP